jgi:hypothetical protein
MNRLITTLWLGLTVVCGHAQITKCSQVLGSAGTSYTLNGRYYAYTVGEVATNTTSNSFFTFTQGFHQPELCIAVATHNIDLSEWGPEIFPVPTEDLLNLRFNGPSAGHFKYRVYDILGREILTDTPVSTSTGAVLHCASWQAGVYFLELKDQEKNAVGTFRFIRI